MKKDVDIQANYPRRTKALLPSFKNGLNTSWNRLIQSVYLSNNQKNQIDK